MTTDVPQCVFVEIGNEPLEAARTITGKDGMPKVMPARQTAWLWIGKRHPIEIKVEIETGTSPYRPGLHLLGGPVFEAGEWGRPKFNSRHLVLVPVAEAFDALMQPSGEDGKPKVAAVK